MKKKKVLWITIAIALILLAMGAVVVAKPSQAKTLPEGIHFNGNSLAGLTPDEAKAKITEYMTYYNSRTVELKVGDQSITITMEDIEFAIEGEDEALADLEEAIPYGNVFDRYKQEKDLEKEPVDIRASVSYNEEVLTNKITEFVIENEVAVEEPTYRKEGNAFVTTSGATGIDYDEIQIIADIKKQLEEAVPNSGKDSVIQYTAEATITEPTLGIGIYDDLNANKLGSFTTLCNEADVNRTTNVELACKFLNGIVVLPGQEASLLDILKVSYASGYKDAGTIVNGQTVMDLGGGVCQVATTLYDALLMAEVEITYRRNHSIASDYVDYSWDAMIHPPSGADFKFRNNLGQSIYIEAGLVRNGNKSSITVTIYGTEYRAANRQIEYYTKVLSSKYIEPYYVVNRWTPSNLPTEGKNYSEPRLYASRSVTATPAVTAELWKRVTVDGKQVSNDRVNGSTYKGKQGVFYLSWDVTLYTWLEKDANGLDVVQYKITDGRYSEAGSHPDVPSNAVVYEWTGQKLNPDGTVYVPPTTEAPTTEAPTTEAPTTETPTTETSSTEELTTAELTTEELTTTE